MLNAKKRRQRVVFWREDTYLPRKDDSDEVTTVEIREDVQELVGQRRKKV